MKIAIPKRPAFALLPYINAQKSFDGCFLNIYIGWLFFCVRIGFPTRKFYEAGVGH